MPEPLSYYAAINIGIGVGIAADAMLATIARARTLRSLRDAVKWAGAIGMTHWLFPMIGFLGGWYLANHGVARALIYGVGGVVLVVYVAHVVRERSSEEAEINAPTAGSFWMAVWGVSIDALITGPGKAAATARWTSAQVALSFPFVGLVVFTLVLVSTVPAMMIHRKIVSSQSESWRPIAMFFTAATWVEVLIFTWFSMLSMVEALGALRVINATYGLASISAAVVGGACAVAKGAKIWRAQSIAARALVA